VAFANGAVIATVGAGVLMVPVDWLELGGLELLQPTNNPKYNSDNIIFFMESLHYHFSGYNFSTFWI
jgi:hypothetical protein